MFRGDYALFLGQEKEQTVVEFDTFDNGFFIVCVDYDVAKETVRELLKNTQEQLTAKQSSDLADFDAVVNKVLMATLPKDKTTLAAGLVTDDVLYLKTLQEGEVYLCREGALAKVVSGNNTASGYIRPGDLFIFTVAQFGKRVDMNLFKGRAVKKPHEIVEEITPELKEKDDSGLAALFVRFVKAPQAVEAGVEVTETIAEETVAMQSVRSRFRGIFSTLFYKLHTLQIQSSKRRQFTLVAVVILFVILAWSVVFGLKRRESARVAKEIAAASEIIDQKLSEAADVSILNLDRAQILLSEAKQELSDLKKTVGDEQTETIDKMKQKLAAAEKMILKKEDKKPTVFYDLNLIEKEARADRMYRDKDSVVLLNSTDGKIYLLNLDKKSIRTVKKSEIKGADVVALYNGVIFFADKETGIFKVDAENKVIKAVEKDENWGKLTKLWIYNGNLYLLDSNKDQIYKYLVASEGYSAKSSYFKENQAIKLDPEADMAIDSSVYIASKDRVYKYISGARDSFSVSFPADEERAFSRLFTSPDTAKLYVLDREHAKLYILSKEGQYEKQIESSTLASADDVVVYDTAKSIYVLVDDKIYAFGQ